VDPANPHLHGRYRPCKESAAPQETQKPKRRPPEPKRAALEKKEHVFF
jgi:hypothetical protein